MQLTPEQGIRINIHCTCCTAKTQTAYGSVSANIDRVGSLPIHNIYDLALCAAGNGPMGTWCSCQCHALSQRCQGEHNGSESNMSLSHHPSLPTTLSFYPSLSPYFCLSALSIWETRQRETRRSGSAPRRNAPKWKRAKEKRSELESRQNECRQSETRQTDARQSKTRQCGT